MRPVPIQNQPPSGLKGVPGRGIADWITTLSLDPVLVVLPWQACFAAAFHLSLTPAHAWVLAASVWMGYSADRWLDAQRDPNHPGAGPRHQFARAHRRPLLLLWAGVLAGSVAVAVCQFPATVLARGAAVAAAALLYTLTARSFGRRKKAKALCVATLMSAAVGVLLGPLDAWKCTALVGLAGLFYLNTRWIRDQEEEALPTLWNSRFTSAWPALLLAGSFRGALPVYWTLAVTLSFLALYAVLAWGRNLPSSRFRLLVDLATGLPPGVVFLNSIL